MANKQKNLHSFFESGNKFKKGQFQFPDFAIYKPVKECNPKDIHIKYANEKINNLSNKETNVREEKKTLLKKNQFTFNQIRTSKLICDTHMHKFKFSKEQNLQKRYSIINDLIKDKICNLMDNDIKLMKSTLQSMHTKMISLTICCKYSELWIRKTQDINIYKQLIHFYELFNKELKTQWTVTWNVNDLQCLFMLLWKKFINNLFSICQTCFKCIELYIINFK